MASDSESTLVIELRRSRRKARKAAVAEVVALLRDVGARPSVSGPMAEVAGVAWVVLPTPNIQLLSQRLTALGYCERIHLVVEDVDSGPPGPTVRWKGKAVKLVPIYFEGDAELRQLAPDQREFLLECGDGVVRRINGYRGGRGPLEHRALPVIDARLLVNLVFHPDHGTLLDPFAGAGSVSIVARNSGWTTISIDLDAALRFGLNELSHRHLVGDARHLPFDDRSISAIATEPPYHSSATDAIVESMKEMARVIQPGRHISLLVAEHQMARVLDAGRCSGLKATLAEAIDRKGMDVACLCFEHS